MSAAKGKVEERSMDDLRAWPEDELERRAREHFSSALDELRAVETGIREQCRPSALLRRHPLVVSIVGGLAAFWLLGKLLRRGRAGKPVPSAAPAKAEPLHHTFGRSFLTNVARAAGAAVPTMALWAIRRGKRKGRS